MQIVGNPSRTTMIGGATVIQEGSVGFAQQLIRQDMDRYLDTMQHTPGDTYADVTANLTRHWQDAQAHKMMGIAGALCSAIGAFALIPGGPLVQVGVAAIGATAGGLYAHCGSQQQQQIGRELSNIEAWTGTVQMTGERYEAEAAKLKAAKQDELQKLKESLVLGTAGIDEREDTVAIGGVNIPTR